MTDQALRAEIEAALSKARFDANGRRTMAVDGAAFDALNRRLADAVLPLVEAQRLAARHEALAEVRAGIEAKMARLAKQYPSGPDNLGLMHALNVLDSAEASQ